MLWSYEPFESLSVGARKETLTIPESDFWSDTVNHYGGDSVINLVVFPFPFLFLQ